MRPYILAESNWTTVKQTDYEVAVLPWGATEAHNYHLPYATDNIQCDYIAAESARLAWENAAKVVVLPTIPFGVNTGQFNIKLDINMNPGTQALVLRDVVESLSKQGIPKLLVMNGHGGNNFKQMIRELQPRFPTVFLCSMDWYKVIDWGRYFEDLGDHAGEVETSVMLEIAPELVRALSEAGSGKARSFKIAAFNEGWAWTQREWSKVTADTGIGNPKKASAEKGKAFLDDLIRTISGFLVELSDADPNDLYQ